MSWCRSNDVAMSKPFDATTRALIELGPGAWLRFLRSPVSDPDRIGESRSSGDVVDGDESHDGIEVPERTGG
jgi:hypothetical protein